MGSVVGKLKGTTVIHGPSETENPGSPHGEEHNTNSTIAELIDQVDELLTELANLDRDKAETIHSAHPNHQAGVENLQHYAYLRSRDLRPLQAKLESLGIITTAATSVRDQLLAARNLLGALAGHGPTYDDAIAASIAGSTAELATNSQKLLGPTRENMPSRIMVTLPTEAATDPTLVQSFAEAGMDLARINCAHDGPEDWAAMIENVREASRSVGRHITISMDLAGPKLRTGDIIAGPKVGRARVTRTSAGRILTPSKLWITPLSRDPEHTPAPVPEGLPGRRTLEIQADPEWLAGLSKGDEISMLDARGTKRYMTVQSTSPEGVLAVGQRNVYLADGTLISSNYIKTRIYGIEPTDQRIHVSPGTMLELTTEPVTTDPLDAVPRIYCPVPEAIATLEKGKTVLFDDGLIVATVISTQQQGEFSNAHVRVTRAGMGGKNLAAHKGIHFPGTELPLPTLTEDDRETLSFVLRNADIVAASFVRSESDVEAVLEAIESEAVRAEQAGEGELASAIRSRGLLLKIETESAYKNLPAIISTLLKHDNSGLMIARGDLAVELGFARMADAPRQIMNAAEAARVPVVVATQVLETMAKSGLPSRAEITDAAEALSAEAVMLNKGAHIEAAIDILNTIARTFGKSRHKNRELMRHIRSWD